MNIPHRFIPREYQKRLFNSIHDGKKRAIAVRHRRAGKDKTPINLQAKEAAKKPGLYFFSGEQVGLSDTTVAHITITDDAGHGDGLVAVGSAASDFDDAFGLAHWLLLAVGRTCAGFAVVAASGWAPVPIAVLG